MKKGDNVVVANHRIATEIGKHEKERLEVFNDTPMLADFLYDLTHDGVVNGELSQDEKYHLMEARDNLLGLYELCKDLLRNQ